VARVEAADKPVDIEDLLDGLKEPALLLVLDGVTDPHNLGACLRVADAMGAHAVIAPKDRAVGITPTVEKVASGAAETVPFISVTNLARALGELKEREVWVIGADQGAEHDLYSIKLDSPIAWVLGAEGEGMRRLTRETCDELASIPMMGSVESLNVSVSAGICLAETRRQRQTKRGKS
jgi:23S rRNA (guanosine2251-2'-O)-methyltransferase